MEVVPNEAKLAELVLYIAKRLLDDVEGGATKINKVLFSAEFAHVRLHGAPITGIEYQKLKQGPAPRRLLPVVIASWRKEQRSWSAITTRAIRSIG